MKSQKGYSLIEIVVGLVVITLFLLTTGSLINASYTNYYLILQRNEAMDCAIKTMEEILSSDDILSSGETLSYDGSFDIKVNIDNVSYSDDKNQKIISDKVFKVGVEVSYSKSPTSKNKNKVRLESLKIVK